MVVRGHGGREDVELQRLCDFGGFFRDVVDVAGRELAGGDEGGEGVLVGHQFFKAGLELLAECGGSVSELKVQFGCLDGLRLRRVRELLR